MATISFAWHRQWWRGALRTRGSMNRTCSLSQRMFETMISSQVRTLFAYIVVSYANCNSGEEEMQYAQREQAYIEPFGFWKDFEKRIPSGGNTGSWFSQKNVSMLIVCLNSLHSSTHGSDKLGILRCHFFPFSLLDLTSYPSIPFSCLVYSIFFKPEPDSEVLDNLDSTIDWSLQAILANLNYSYPRWPTDS